MLEPPKWEPEPEIDEAKPLIFDGQRANVKGLLWEVAVIGPSWINLRPVHGGETQAAYFRGGSYVIDGETVLFFDSLAESVDGPHAEQLKKRIVRELNVLLPNTVRSVNALGSKLTPSEREEILGATEQAQKALVAGDLKHLSVSYRLLERLAVVIGRAMLRP